MNSLLKLTAQETPLISFIIPFYNVPTELLIACIDSILRLSLRPSEREIIVIDDGSTMSPINELMNYGDDIIYIRKKNGGLGSARNKGIDIAIGKYIQFIDADDELIQAPYEHCLDIIRYNEADMVVFDFCRNKDVPLTFETARPTTGVQYMRHNNIHGAAWGYTFRKDILGELRFIIGYYHEDEEFTPQLLLRAENVYVTTAKAYYYRSRPTSIITSNDKRSKIKRLDDKRTILLKLHDMCDKLPYNDRMAMQRRVAQVTMDYIYDTIITTRSQEHTNKRLTELRNKGLFPLPDCDYTTKYKWFRRMTNSEMGLKLLLKALPLLKREQ